MRLGSSAGIIRVRDESLEQGGNSMSIFPTTILLATDGSAEAQLAARTAADLAQRTDSELHVVTVGAGVPISATTSPAHCKDVLREHRHQAEEVLDQQLTRIE